MMPSWFSLRKSDSNGGVLVQTPKLPQRRLDGMLHVLLPDLDHWRVERTVTWEDSWFEVSVRGLIRALDISIYRREPDSSDWSYEGALSEDEKQKLVWEGLSVEIMLNSARDYLSERGSRRRIGFGTTWRPSRNIIQIYLTNDEIRDAFELMRANYKIQEIEAREGIASWIESFGGELPEDVMPISGMKRIRLRIEDLRFQSQPNDVHANYSVTGIDI